MSLEVVNLFYDMLHPFVEAISLHYFNLYFKIIVAFLNSNIFW